MARYIGADKLLEYLEKAAESEDVKYSFIGAGVQATVSVNKAFPLEDVAPVIHAHWRWMRNHDVICSKCQYVLPSGSPVSDFRFCPHCGAKMDEVTE